MNRGTMRQNIRDSLGDPGPYGFWSDDELNRHIKQVCDQHAQEALSYERSRPANSVPGVMEYALPDDFGELKDVRYEDGVNIGFDSLDYVNRDAILEEVGEIDEVGDPYCFYKWQDCIGLYPVPNKSPIFETKFTGEHPQHYADVYALEAHFTNTMNLHLETEVGAEPVYRIYISNISLYLRREARPYPGRLLLQITEASRQYANISKPVEANVIKPFGEWYAFDFSDAPIEVANGSPVSFEMAIRTSDEYQNAEATPASYYGKGVQVAVNDTTNPVAYFQLHQLKDDIEIDYYSNVTPELTSDDDEIVIPQRYHRTLIKMVLARAWRKQNRDLRAAETYEKDADDEIAYARSQAAVKVLKPIRRVERFRRGGRGRYMTYENGRFKGRAW